MSEIQLVKTSTGPQIVRAADTFKSSAPVSASGDSAIWTPAAGKFWYLLWYVVEVTADATKAAGGQVIALTLRDGTTSIGLIHSAYIPTTIPTNATGLCYTSGMVQLGSRGIAGTVAAQALNINLSFALDTGKVRVRAGGIEE